MYRDIYSNPHGQHVFSSLKYIWGKTSFIKKGLIQLPVGCVKFHREKDFEKDFFEDLHPEKEIIVNRNIFKYFFDGEWDRQGILFHIYTKKHGFKYIIALENKDILAGLWVQRNV